VVELGVANVVFIVLGPVGLRRSEVVDCDNLTVRQQRAVFAVNEHREFVVELGSTKLGQLTRGEDVAELERDHVIEPDLHYQRGRVTRVTGRVMIGAFRGRVFAYRGPGYLPGTEHDTIADSKLATRESAHGIRVPDGRDSRIQRHGGRRKKR
jgi:hypothetical protein